MKKIYKKRLEMVDVTIKNGTTMVCRPLKCFKCSRKLTVENWNVSVVARAEWHDVCERCKSKC